MSIIISNNGERAVRVEKSSIGSEDRLQQYIYDNPESIPLYEIKEDIQLLILAREFGTNSGPIDALGIDKYGEIYVVETKLFSNADKRKVIAQALDYGAALWKHANDFADFTTTLDHHTMTKFNQSLQERIGAFFGLTEEVVESTIEQIRRNLDEGVFHFVVLMDELDDRLKDIILYVNKNSQFDIYAVELEYYKHETHEIIIPRLFGAEVKKSVMKSSTQKRQWDWESFRDERLAEFGQSAIDVAARIIEWSTKHGISIEWGNSQRGSFIMCFYINNKWGFYPFTVSGNGYIGWNAPHQGDKAPEPFNDIELRREILTKLSDIKDVTLDPSNVNGYKAANIPLTLLAEEKNIEHFFNTCLWIRSELDKVHPPQQQI